MHIVTEVRNDLYYVNLNKINCERSLSKINPYTIYNT